MPAHPTVGQRRGDHEGEQQAGRQQRLDQRDRRQLQGQSTEQLAQHHGAHAPEPHRLVQQIQ